MQRQPIKLVHDTFNILSNDVVYPAGLFDGNTAGIHYLSTIYVDQGSFFLLRASSEFTMKLILFTHHVLLLDLREIVCASFFLKEQLWG